MKFSIRGTFELTSADEYISKLRTIQPGNLIDIWPLTVDTNPAILLPTINNPTYKGFYNGTPPFSFQDTLFPDGVNYAPYLHRSLGQLGILPGAVASAISPNEGTLLIWFKMRLAEAANNQFGVMFNLFGDIAGNAIRIFKANAANGIQWDYNGGGIIVAVNVPIIFDDDWACYISTWSRTNNRFRAYFRGSQVGTDQSPLPVWTATTFNVMSVGSDGGSHSEGAIALATMWSKELTPAEVLLASRVP